ncbi:unnamed protein product [Ilex paraguariensis]|uniref:Uncharacterized protein n=1 Tax=Ilex paraguariensis TaxID=185542 RepID=A0ABC8R220_9AQUA
MGLGPRFMSIYIHKLAIERRIYYDEIEGLTVEWLDATSTLVISLCTNKRFHRRGSPGKGRTLEEVALIISPYDLEPKLDFARDICNKNSVSPIEGNISKFGTSGTIDIIPAVFPLTVSLLSTIPIALHAIGGEDGPTDMVARLYMSSYFS